MGDSNGTRDVFVLDRLKGVIERVSIADNGGESDNSSSVGGISDDGTFVSFSSFSNILVSNDANGVVDVFVRDRVAKQTICVSRNPAGDTANSFSVGGSLSADGSVIAFQSAATDLVANDTNGSNDVFVHDLATGTTVRASVNGGGVELDAPSAGPVLSRDGGLLSFVTAATNLHRDATTGVEQCYVVDLGTTEIWLASRGVDSLASDSACFHPTLFTRRSADGPVDLVAFWSSGTNLSGDGGSDMDAYVIDFRSGLRQCVTVDSEGIDPSDGVSIGRIAASPDGDAVVFPSDGASLVKGDKNGANDVFLRGLQWTEPSEIGDGLAGTGAYVPRLTGRGGSCESSRWFLEILDGLPQAPGLIWVGFGRTNGLPLFGGTFYVDLAQPFFTIPVVLGGPAGVGGAGELFLDGVNVEDVGQFSMYLQCMFLDARALKGISLSNALELAIDA